jgi:Regulator of chromosome condensation (RCC1) repeat
MAPPFTFRNAERQDTRVSEQSKVSCVSGSAHACLNAWSLGAGSTRVLAWGRGEDGQLGHGTASDHHEPCLVRALNDAGATQVVCGAEFSVAVCPGSRSVYSWGWCAATRVCPSLAKPPTECLPFRSLWSQRLAAVITAVPRTAACCLALSRTHEHTCTMPPRPLLCACGASPITP